MSIESVFSAVTAVTATMTAVMCQPILHTGTLGVDIHE
jgi:hypothetical protein